MAEPTTVGSTRVSLIPDTSSFGDRLRVELPSAIRQPAKLAGRVAGEEILDGIQRKLAAATPTVHVGVDIKTMLATAQLDKLTKARTLKVTVQLDDKAATGALAKLTADRKVTVKASLDDAAARTALGKLTDQRTVKVVASLDEAAAKAALGKLTGDRTVKVTAQVDDTAAKAKLAGFGKTTVDIVAKIQDAAYKRVEAALDKLTKDRTVLIRATADTRVAADEIRNLARRQKVRIGVDVDTRVAAADIANLTRRRQIGVTARADTAGANTALTLLTRDRTVSVRTRLLGIGSLTTALAGLGGAGDSGGGLGRLPKAILLIGGAILSSLPTIASFGSALAQLGPLAAVAAPGILTLGAAFGAIKLGMSGVGAAIKEAFADTSGEAKVAATATKQVETAQRSLANAQRSVTDAERNLSQAQREARQVQTELSAARRQAARDLEDMNQRLHQGALDQKQAALDVEQAELDLQNVRTDPAATQLQIQQADLALQRAKASATEQGRQQKRLQVDTAAANKAGVSGSDAVVQAQRRIRAASEQVAQQQRSLADAHRAVADATRAVADAQSTAATQTTKLDTALSKLSPNARGFVAILQEMAPAWRAMKLDVQDALFAGLGARLQRVGTQILPTVRAGLVGAATELGTMGKNALTAVGNLEQTGQLKGTFDVIRNGLGNLNKIPGQIVTGLSQLTIAAGPAWDRITAGAGSAMDRVMDKLAKGLKSGKLEEAINTALDVAVAFGKVLADLFGILKNVMGAAADAGGDFFAVIGKALAEIRRITALPEVQDALKAIFTAVQSIATLIAGTLGSVIQAVLPLLAALAPTITVLANALGPVLAQLAASLGQALMPVITALLPIIGVLGQGILDIVTALLPVLKPIGQVIGAIVAALGPVIGTVVDVIVQVVSALAGPLATIISGLMPVVTLLADLIGETLTALMPALTPIIGIVALLAQSLGTVVVSVLQALIPALQPLIPVIVLIAQIFSQLVVAILTPLMPIITLLAQVFGQVLVIAIQALAPILKLVADVFMQLLPALQPLFPIIGQLVGALAQLLTPLLGLLTLALKPLLAVIGFVAGLLVKGLGAALNFLVPIVVKVLGWVVQLATVITKAVKGIVTWFKWLFDVLLGHSIIPDIVRGAIKWFTDLKDKALKIFQWIKDGIHDKWAALWGAVKTTASAAWGIVKKGFDAFADGLKGAFDGLKKGIGKIWDGLKALVKAPIKFWIETVYNNGIVKVWNKTAGKIPGVPDLKTMQLPKGFARGGVLPGQSSWRQGDDQLVPMRRGEGVYVSEAMRDPYERARLHAVNQAAMQGRSLSRFRGFAEGGIFSGITNAVGSVLSKGADVARGGLADLAASAFKPIKSGITKVLGSNKNTYPGMIGAAPIGFIDKAIDYIRGKDIPPEGTGQWMKPVHVGYGTPFGKAGLMWSSGRHTGLDFPAKTGTPVHAVDNGEVRSAVSGGPYGKHIEISHGGGLSSLYAHMSAMVAKAGQGIKRGARVGSVGATGNVTGPHLHLEARINGKTVDPMRYLEGGTGGEAGAGVERYRGVVTQALGQVGQSLALVNTTLRRMNQESGGNPRAVNRNDINWINGTPSVGLMQVIKGTFAAYAGKYKKTGPFMYGVSVDPMANVYASMKYALSRYGSLSAAYNRIGGYAQGGIIGGGIHINTGLPRTTGYATGGIIKVGGKKIDTGPLRAAVGGDFLKQLTGTAATIDKAMTAVATALKNAFKGVKTTLDDKLLKVVTAQNKALQKLAGERDKIRDKIAAANTFAADTTKSGASFAALTGLPNSGLPFGANGVLDGLKVRLGQLKTFSANIAALAKRGLSKDLIGQIIAAGPDQGAPYAAALVAATDAQLKDINATQAQISKASTAYGQSAADAMYDAGAMSGKGYLAGLKAQEKAIVAAMTSLAKKVQKTLKVELKISSPSRVMDALGRFTGLGYANGVRATIPQAAEAAASMARVVRSTTAATVARTEVNTTTNQGGERHLHYQATTREVASRRSILDALAMDEMLHRTAVVGA
ncbi:peptidoglycan DD-metalloendopeptidase family protein [Streptomyces brevispora]|uniref:peptidoglycan DD-metalloendopeptidase family protein n=1 Tax=Streptomyces brevispora TaxID=887462 RepID=UPI002E32E9F6|nr:peptidoglycan DD-metalloendopeptidase family protein [Streptomyces brevispora]